MSVDKAKDTSPKKPITENNIVEAKPESSTKTENKPDAKISLGKNRTSNENLHSWLVNSASPTMSLCP